MKKLTNTLPIEDLAYVFRFNGFARFPPVGLGLPMYLVGLGKIVLSPDGSLRGDQRSSNVRTVGETGPIQHTHWQIEGHYELRTDNGGDAVLKFFLVRNGQPARPHLMLGEFAISYEGPVTRPTRLWLISSRTQRLATRNGNPIYEDVPEIVNGAATLLC